MLSPYRWVMLQKKQAWNFANIWIISFTMRLKVKVEALLQLQRDLEN